jgi:hypothetical protein
VQKKQRLAFKIAADPAAIGSKLIDDPFVSLIQITHLHLLIRYRFVMSAGPAFLPTRQVEWKNGESIENRSRAGLNLTAPAGPLRLESSSLV